MKYLIFTIVLIFSVNLFATNYEFIPFENGRIGKIMKNNGFVYFYASNGTIYKIDLNEEISPIIVYSKNELESQGVSGIGDWEFWNEKIIAVGGNKVVNITDNITYSVKDEFDNEKSSGAKKYRNFGTVCVDSNNKLIITSGATIVKEIDQNGIKYVDRFSEVYEVNKNFEFKRIIKGELNNFVNYNDPICTPDNEIFYIDNQSSAGKGGLIKLGKDRNREVFDLESHSGKVYKKWPNFMTLYEGDLAIGYSPRKDGGYPIEGVSYFNPKTENWTHDNRFIEEIFNDNFPEKMGFHPLTGIKKLDDDLTAYLGKGIIFKNKSTYKFLDLNKILREKEEIESWYVALDIYKANKSYVVIHKEGVFIFPESVTSVESDKNEYIETYEIINNKLLFGDSDSKNFSIYNVNGKLFSKGKVIKELSLSHLEHGLYFIVINNKFAVKFLKE